MSGDGSEKGAGKKQSLASGEDLDTYVVRHHEEVTIEVPIHGEEVEIQKSTRVGEEVSIEKDVVVRETSEEAEKDHSGND